MTASADFSATARFLHRSDTVTIATALRTEVEARAHGNGPAGRRCQRALRTRRSMFPCRRGRNEVTVEPAAEAAPVARDDRVSIAKYGDQWPTRSMTSDHARGTTFRVESGYGGVPTAVEGPCRKTAKTQRWT